MRTHKQPKPKCVRDSNHGKDSKQRARFDANTRCPCFTGVAGTRTAHLHRFFETRSLLPEQTLPSGEVRALEQGVLQNTLDTTERLDHIRAVVVQVPKLAIVTVTWRGGRENTRTQC